MLHVLIRPKSGDLAAAITLTEVLFNEGEGSVTLEGTEASLLDALPVVAAIGPNAPNPFNPVTTIPYAVPYDAQVGLEAVATTLTIYSVTGQVIRTLVDQSMMPGRYQATWTGTDRQGREVASGVYVAMLRSGGQSRVMRMVLLR